MVIKTISRQDDAMGPGYYVIAILGCADGSAACTPLATVATRYESEATCSAATHGALLANSDLDSPNLVAQCRAVATPATSAQESPRAISAGAQRG